MTTNPEWRDPDAFREIRRPFYSDSIIDGPFPALTARSRPILHSEIVPDRDRFRACPADPVPLSPPRLEVNRTYRVRRNPAYVDMERRFVERNQPVARFGEYRHAKSH